MRKETVTYEIFKFDELSEAVQKEVLNSMRDYNVEDIDWWQCVYDMWYERLEAMGFRNPEINFSGFWSQGDGASFTCDSIDVSKLMDCLAFRATGYKDCLKYLKLKIMADYGVFGLIPITRRQSHYVHEYTCSADMDTEVYHYGTKRTVDAADDLEVIINTTIHRLNKRIYKSLEADYAHLTSDECIRELILANDYEFLSNGKVWRS